MSSRYQPNPIVLAPATPEACAGDLRATRLARDEAAGRARDQFAFAGMAARGADPRAAVDEAETATDGSSRTADA
jgi:hypothetical protein